VANITSVKPDIGKLTPITMLGTTSRILIEWEHTIPCRWQKKPNSGPLYPVPGTCKFLYSESYERDRNNKL